jgi:tripartite-type tricarboxylate transporter receptor subunit TctC
MMGGPQRDWLFRSLENSPASWNILAQQVMMARVDRAGGTEVKYSMDQWPGYEFERRRVLREFLEKRIKNPVVITGDIHTHWANELVADFDELDSPVVGTEFVGRSDPDGHTLLATGMETFSISPFIYGKLSYDPEKDIAPVTQTGSLPYIIVLHPSLPSRNVKEFIALAKSRPGEINFASSGIGTASHLAGEYFASTAKISMTHVPYKGTGNAMADLLAGQVVLLFDQPVSSIHHVKAGKLRVLGITSAQRFPTMQEIPTVAEQGLPGFEVVSWSGVCAPGATPKPVVQRLQTEVSKVLKMPEIRDRLMRDGIEPVGGTPEEFQAHIKREMVKWSKVVRDAKVVAQ